MTRYPLTIEVASPNAAVARAVAFLLRDERLDASVRLVSGPRGAPRGRVLRIESGSVMGSALTVLWGEALPKPTDEQDVALALSTAIWADSTVADLWQHTSAPLPSSRLGAPDHRRPWVLVDASARISPQWLEGVTNLRNIQAHFTRLSLPGHAAPVWWLPRPRTLAALMGQVDAVVAAPGPLAWDAMRAGVPVFAPPSTTELASELATRRLASTIPSALSRNGVFWRDLAFGLCSGAANQSWGTAAWLLHARQQLAPASASTNAFSLHRVRRKLNKLRRDPASFWADSALARFYREVSL